NTAEINRRVYAEKIQKLDNKRLEKEKQLSKAFDVLFAHQEYNKDVPREQNVIPIQGVQKQLNNDVQNTANMLDGNQEQFSSGGWLDEFESGGTTDGEKNIQQQVSQSKESPIKQEEIPQQNNNVDHDSKKVNKINNAMDSLQPRRIYKVGDNYIRTIVNNVGGETVNYFQVMQGDKTDVEDILASKNKKKIKELSLDE